MGNADTKYISELSDDNSENEWDYSLEPRSIGRNSFATTSSHISSPSLQSKRVYDIVRGTSNMRLDLATASGTDNATSKDLTVDAAPKVNCFPKPEIVITLDKVLLIENDLDQYEIVSLVYLLYEDALFALQELVLLLSGAQKQLLYDWAKNENSLGRKWQRKLIEALCIIKNYQVLRELGYKKKDVIADFLPHVISAETSVNRLKKAVYLICEKLDSQKAIVFLHYADKSFLEKNMEPARYDPVLLELYFLNWETVKWISATDMSNVKKILKLMDEEYLLDLLNKAIPLDLRQEEPVRFPPGRMSVMPERRFRQHSTSIDTHQRPPRTVQGYSPTLPENVGQEDYQFSPPCPTLPTLGQDNVHADDISRYNIDPENPGVLLIINQETFYTEVRADYKHLLADGGYKLENREGSREDQRYMMTVFRRFGFKVVTANSLSHEDMIEEITGVVNGVRKESSLLVCIMSHGEKGIVYGSNSCKVKVSQIQEIMCGRNKENLSEKPKVLILQSCQGRECQKESDVDMEEDDDEHQMTTDGPKSSPRMMDLFTFWATVAGYAAVRSRRTGSWFIQALCQKLEELGNREHFVDVCTQVVNSVCTKKWTVENNVGNVMTPEMRSTLRKRFYFPPIRSN
ncbi:hypothetical protein NQ318_019827 [Aromia moschata]|uniref:Caspase-8 n=1 Tax=Aromia moschata TaxID=1265417 RepID=A0AAV8YK23_9CUCU|nr:hypothetical protein NQ318_019827 [Aromia moschata]